MVLFFKSREGRYIHGRTFREFAQARAAKGLFARRLDFGRDAPTGRRWAVQVKDAAIPAGAVTAK